MLFVVNPLNIYKMKKLINFCAITLFIFIACKNEKAAHKTKQEIKNEIIAFDSFGAKITQDGALNSNEMLLKFNNLKVGDTINLKFASKIKEVCSKKGCWMKLPLDDETK